MAAEAGVEINGVSAASKPAPADPNASPDAQFAESADSADATDGKPPGRSGGRLQGYR